MLIRLEVERFLNKLKNSKKRLCLKFTNQIEKVTRDVS